MPVKITGMKEIEKNIKKIALELGKEAKKPIRKALNAGAKELKKEVKSLTPVLHKPTRYRAKGTLKKSIRHKTEVAQNGRSGEARIFVSNKKKASSFIERKRKRRDAKGRLLTGLIAVYHNNPFYAHIVESGSVKMQGRHFMERGGKKGLTVAFRKTEEVFKEELYKASSKFFR